MQRENVHYRARPDITVHNQEQKKYVLQVIIVEILILKPHVHLDISVQEDLRPFSHGHQHAQTVIVPKFRHLVLHNKELLVHIVVQAVLNLEA
jgi:hypothetical protein